MCVNLYFLYLCMAPMAFIYSYISLATLSVAVYNTNTHTDTLYRTCMCMKFQRVTIKNASLLLFFFFSSFFDGFFTICTNFLIDTIT